MVRRKRLNIRGKYHRQGCTNIYKPFKNHIFVGANTTLEHLQAVTAICHRLKKSGHDFITEAVPNSNPRRRVDIVDLTTGEEIEVEHTGKFKEDADKSYKIISQKEYEKLKSSK